MSLTEPVWRCLAKPILLAISTLVAPCVAIGAPTGQFNQTTAVPNSGLVGRSTLSKYERDVLASVLEERHLTLELNPEGKSVESIEVEPLEVFEPADPLPGWLNWFHTTSRTEVIEREVLISAGQHYDQQLVDETARNLRRLKQLSLVLVIPIRSEQRDRVRILVVTKDVWSLRLNESFRVRNAAIEFLSLQLTEENFAGNHLQFAGQYTYDLATNMFGGAVSHQRLFGSHIGASLSINAIQHRATGKFEGSTGALRFAQPLYSTRTKWAWGTSLTWDNRINRRLLPTSAGTYVPRVYRDPSVPNAEPIPYRYRSRLLSWQTAVTRSYGLKQKSNFTFGIEALQRSINAEGLIAEGYSTEAVRRFEQNALEHKNVRIGPFAQLESYRNDYVSMFDIETLGLQEDIQLGPMVFLKFYSGTKRALGTRDLVGISTGIQHSANLAGSLLRLWATHLTELSPERQDRDGLVQAGVRLISPPIGIGRFVYDGGLLYHYQNSRNLRYALGGDTRLRGYPSEQFLGHHVVASNLEFRSRSVKVLEVLFGLVGFYDVGDAFDSMSGLHPKHSIGIGGRATFPQLQRIVGRLDLAFPLSHPVSQDSERWSNIAVFLTVGGQAFPMPVVQGGTTRSPLMTPPD